jgi:mannose-6-phosphate isomerase-like protein (cupin superfamily)
MLRISNIDKALAGVRFLENRTPDGDTAGTFATLASYRDGGIFTGGFSGTSAWEKHPAEEVLQVIDGAATLSLITETGREDHEITTGDLVVVPTGHWHRFHAPKGITLLSVTPQPTDHFTGDGEPET